jgi:hypothetical protein
MYRQGDILIVEIAQKNLPAGLRALDHKTLAEGEATGHAHVLDGEAQLMADHAGEIFFEVTESTPLVHEEHDTIVIPEGMYRVVRQREFDGEQIRRVYD